MKSFFSSFTSLEWWFSVFIVGLILNVIGNYVFIAVNYSVKRLNKYNTEGYNEMQERFHEIIIKANESEGNRLELFLRAIYLSIRGYLIMGVGLIGMVKLFPLMNASYWFIIVLAPFIYLFGKGQEIKNTGVLFYDIAKNAGNIGDDDYRKKRQTKNQSLTDQSS